MTVYLTINYQVAIREEMVYNLLSIVTHHLTDDMTWLSRYRVMSSHIISTNIYAFFDSGKLLFTVFRTKQKPLSQLVVRASTGGPRAEYNEKPARHKIILRLWKDLYFPWAHKWLLAIHNSHHGFLAISETYAALAILTTKSNKNILSFWQKGDGEKQDRKKLEIEEDWEKM